MNKIVSYFKNKLSLFNKICIVLFLYSVVVLIVSRLVAPFADFYNRYISAGIRYVWSHVTGVLPFSLGEAIFLSIPVIVGALVITVSYYTKRDEEKGERFVINLFCALTILFSMFVNSYAVGYGCTTLDEKLKLQRKDVSAEELSYTADVLLGDINSYLPKIDYRVDGSSIMPFTYKELNEKLNSAYDKVCKEYKFIPKLHSNVKILAISPIMTYTHISGVYTYYTCESNLNYNYPDYTTPYTMAHEMAHQRGFAREDEANFIAYLVCTASDDDYIKYSATQSVFEYVMDALYTADATLYSKKAYELDIRIKREMNSFSSFFEKYRNSDASKVADTVNDTLLKASGQKAGSQSYGLVVDLICAYYKK